MITAGIKSGNINQNLYSPCPSPLPPPHTSIIEKLIHYIINNSTFISFIYFDVSILLVLTFPKKSVFK